MEAAAAGKAEDGQCDFAACFYDALFGVLQVLGFDDSKRSLGALGWIGVEAARSSAFCECGVGWAVVLKCPAEEVGIKPGPSE